MNIYCVEDKDGGCCRFHSDSLKTLASHIAREHHRWYSNASAMKRAKYLRRLSEETQREDAMYAMGFVRCISAWAPDFGESRNAHYVRPDQMANKYDCVACVARRNQEAA